MSFSKSESLSGKNVANTNILANCVKMYTVPACMHFQNAPYSDLKVYTPFKFNSRAIQYNLQSCALIGQVVRNVY